MTAFDTARRERGIVAIVVRVLWGIVWAFVTAFAWFEVVKRGYVLGSPVDAVVLTGVAVGVFILPDLTFVIGAAESVPKGSISTRAVPWHDALHRFWPPLVLTFVVGIGFDPLRPFALAVFIGGLSWIAHVALDRVAGYGLRKADGSR